MEQNFNFAYTFQPVPTPKRPNEEDLEDSEDEGKGSKKAKRSNKSAINRMQQLGNKTLPKEPIITDKEKEDILRYVETEATEVSLYYYD